MFLSYKLIFKLNYALRVLKHTMWLDPCYLSFFSARVCQGRKEIGSRIYCKKADKLFTSEFFYVHDSNKPNNLCKSLACHGLESILKLYDVT